jgi:DNA-binding NarL/FixJ family response regulator
MKPDMPSPSPALECSIIYTNEPLAPNMPPYSTPPDASAENSKQEKMSKQMKMLLVEDSKLLRYILFDAINHLENVTVAGTATTQQQAIELLDETPFDIVLLDIELAQGNGFEVIKHLQQKDYAFKPPVMLMLTNHAHPHYRNLAKTLGVPYFFDKSMDFDLAIDAIELEAERFSNAQH